MFAAPPAVQRATSHSGSLGGYSASSSFNRGGGSTDNLNSLNKNTQSPSESGAASSYTDSPEPGANGFANGNSNGSANGCSFCPQEAEQSGEEQLPRLELGVSHTSFTGGRVNGSTFLYRVVIDK
jgi:hypothetical protein